MKAPGQVEHEIAAQFSNEQIYHVALTCRAWADADTADPIGSLEDAETLKFCFFECLKVLKARGSTTYLHLIFMNAHVDDGWRTLWYETLGADWLEKNPHVMPDP